MELIMKRSSCNIDDFLNEQITYHNIIINYTTQSQSYWTIPCAEALSTLEQMIELEGCRRKPFCPVEPQAGKN